MLPRSLYYIIPVAAFVCLTAGRIMPLHATVIAPPKRGYNDGDTRHIQLSRCVSVGKGERICGKTSLRLSGVNAPEYHTKSSCEKKLGAMAKARMDELAPVGSRLTLSHITREKFGRLMADATNEAGVNLGKQLLLEGVARPYYGRKKQVWCTDGPGA